MIPEQREKARNLISDNRTRLRANSANETYSNSHETVCKFEREETMRSSVDEKRMKSPRAKRRRVTAVGREGWQDGGRRGEGSADRWSDLSRLLISEKTDYESRAIVYYRERNGWDYSCCVKLNWPPAAGTIQYVMWI